MLQRVEQALKLPGSLPSGGPRKDLKRLGPKGLLNDEIVNSALALLPPVADVLMLDSFFFPLVSRKKWNHLPKHNALVRKGGKLMVSLSSLAYM